MIFRRKFLIFRLPRPLKPSTNASGDIRFDFDGDGKADVSRWSPSSTSWKIQKSSGGVTTETTGVADSKPVPGDFDGDGKTDVAMFNAGAWTIKKSSDSSIITASWGTSGDVPVVGDYDGDGTSDLAIFRPSTNTWWILQSSTGGYTSTAFGAAGDITVQGNYDGDTKTDIAVYRPSTGTWHIQGTTAGYFGINWGLSSDIPVPADFTGDGKTDFGIYRPSSGTWWVYDADLSGAYTTFSWGNFGDQPMAADFDGDSEADYAVWRPSTGVWYIYESNTSTARYETLGVAGDTAIPSSYVKQVGSLQSEYKFAKDRLSPINATGSTDLYSRNFHWNTGLVSLPGRAGLDVGIGLSYNSLVWTKDTENDVMVFDSDVSNVSPGFKLGYGTIEPVYWDKDNGRYSYLMVTASGARIEFQQIAATNEYETVDSSYGLLRTMGATNPNDPVESITIEVLTTDGTKSTYAYKAGAFRVSEIKDRNGNYLTINHDDQGLLRSVTDTVGRVLVINYDAEHYPISITQDWKDNNGAGPGIVNHVWASFEYADQQIDPDFNSSLGVFGPVNNTNVKMLTKVTYGDPNTASLNTGSSSFSYNQYGQVEKVTNKAADGHTLNYTSTNLDSVSGNPTDTPRFSQTRSWVENFNLNGSGVEQEVVINNTFTTGQTIPEVGGTGTKVEVSMVGHPTSNVSKTFYGESGWKEGLELLTETHADSGNGVERKRWSSKTWTQDDETLSYFLNPRVTESKIGDDENGFVKRTTTHYKLIPNTTISEYGLVESVKIYDGDHSTVLKEVQTDFLLSSSYTDRRIIGLPSEVRTYGIENSSLSMVAKTTYAYDDEDFSHETNQIISAIRHDDTNYGSSFVTGRGNSTSMTRHDPSGQESPIVTKTRFNVTGSVVAAFDEMNRKHVYKFVDDFNDGTASTFAFLTRYENPNGEYYRQEFRRDTGSKVWGDLPHPVSSSLRGLVTQYQYDGLGRLQKQENVKTGSYSRFEYPNSGTSRLTMNAGVDANEDSTIDTNDEFSTETSLNGLGKLIASRSEHPGSSGGWRSTLTEYDIAGRVSRESHQTETLSNYTPVGDDSAGWLWVEYEYDWNSRVTKQINADGTNRLATYNGCGCAGGQTVSISGELVDKDSGGTSQGRRSMKHFFDILGRLEKSEDYDWNGTPLVRSEYSYNGRDEQTKLKKIDLSSSEFTEAIQIFDGFGRTISRTLPWMDVGSARTFEYHPDGRVSSETDGGGVRKDLGYDSIGQLTSISYTSPQGSTIETSPGVTFGYNNSGYRSWMEDGEGRGGLYV